MRIHISASDGVPIYLQIVQQVRRLAAWGELRPGDELPSIRALAEQLMVNPNTIARAYRELEVAGIVTKGRGSGTYLAEALNGKASAERMTLLAERIDPLLRECEQLNIPIEQLVKSLQDRHHALYEASTEEESNGR
jgi:GntR family transcriptional regulator